MPAAITTPFRLLVEWGTDIAMLVLRRVVASRLGVSGVGRDMFSPKGFVFCLVEVLIPTQLLSSLIAKAVLRVADLVP